MHARSSGNVGGRPCTSPLTDRPIPSVYTGHLGLAGHTPMHPSIGACMSAAHLRSAVFAFFSGLLWFSMAGAATLPAGFSETRVAAGLASPTAMAIAPDGRVFVAEKGGTLRVVRNNALLSQPFLTVSVNSASERGLLGVAFDPDFTSNRFVYVYYTTAASPVHNRVSRFTASSTNPDV